MVDKDSPTQSEMDIPMDESDAIDAAMYAGEVARDNWWESLQVDSAAMQLTENITYNQITGYLDWSSVHLDFVKAVFNERHRQHNLGYTFTHDLEHEPTWLPAEAYRRLNYIASDREPSPQRRNRILIEVCALILAELERVDAGN